MKVTPKHNGTRPTVVLLALTLWDKKLEIRNQCPDANFDTNFSLNVVYLYSERSYRFGANKLILESYKVI